MLTTTQEPTAVSEISVHDPQDGTFIASVPRATLADVEAALSKAVAAREIARDLSTYRRTTILRKTAELVDARREEFATTIAREGVKTIREARKEVFRCVETFRFSAEEAHRLNGQTLPFDQRPGSENRVGYFVREPVGIIVAITPFNDPLNLVAHKVGPALAAGNAVILKPDHATPLSALLLARALADAGLPSDVLQVLVGYGREIGTPLISDPRVRMVSFTGGRETGEKILRRMGLKKVSMELGGNCPTIVLNDADLDSAVPECVSGAFWAAGQNCLHVQRLLVHDDIYDEFASRFLTATRAYQLGNKLDETTDMGPMINEAAALRVETNVAEALHAGARLLTGGSREGNAYTPTVLEHVPSSTSLYREEIYGPVTILERFTGLDEAIAAANGVAFGLHAAIFTRDLFSAFSAVRRLECGSVMVNGSTDYRDDSMPFGGVKGSGIGREGVPFAVLEMSEPKVVCFNLNGDAVSSRN
jgi:glyceraldehyde-3-phosphate dehydrogenase (NADP+)